ncbi:MAG TPA: DNA-binding response regulator, partial [Nitrospina sp.]|nr:DNA-binding response regulator [Nitrospina sp.]
MGVLREIQICEIVATGLGDKEISEQLGISTHTVKPHLRSIYSK